MKNCNHCKYVKARFIGKRWTCELNSKKKFNNKHIHGLRCSDFAPSDETHYQSKNPKRVRLLYILGSMVGFGIGTGLALENVLLGVLGAAIELIFVTTIFTLFDWWNEKR